jgi:uncharacterized membrane protein
MSSSNAKPVTPPMDKETKKQIVALYRDVGLLGAVGGATIGGIAGGIIGHIRERPAIGAQTVKGAGIGAVGGGVAGATLFIGGFYGFIRFLERARIWCG